MHRLFTQVAHITRQYKRFRPVTDHEAWAVFRMAAIAEAVGWTMLVIGIICKHIPFAYNEVPVQIAGRLHGVLVLLYGIAALLLAPSLRWDWWKILFAIAASVPPYGSLAFEQWAAHGRCWREFKQLRGSMAYHVVLRAARV